MKKKINNLTVNTLRVEEMFNVRGGNSSENKKDTSSKTNSTATGETQDIIL